jgi:hypothetical protein
VGESLRKLAAVLAQSSRNLMQDRIVQHPGAAQISLPLAGHPRREVACSRTAMLRLAGCCQAKSLFSSLVGLHLGHECTRL